MGQSTTDSCAVRGIGTVEATAGAELLVHPEHDVEPERVRAMLHGIVATFILGQQGRFALHASTVELGHQRVAVSGRSGVGKSTTALRLAQRGATPVVDDVTVLDVVEGVAMTGSWGREIRVFPHVADELQIDLSGGRLTAGPRRKWAIPQPDAALAPVQHVVVLRTADVPAPVLTRPAPLRAARMLGNVLHFPLAARTLWPSEAFAWQMSVVSAVQVVLLRRPAEGSTLDEVCAIIEHLVAEAAHNNERPAPWQLS